MNRLALCRNVLLLFALASWVPGADADDDGFQESDSPVEDAAVLAVGRGMYDDRHAGWRYRGRWKTSSAPGAYKKTVHISKRIGASALFSYAGQGIRIYYRACPDCGEMVVLLNGDQVKTLSTSSPVPEWRRTSVTAPSNGRHRVQILHRKGERLILDALRVLVAPTSPRLPAGCALFPPNNIWNARVDKLPVHARSDAWIDSIGRNAGLHMDFGSGTWNGGPIGIPYNVVEYSKVKTYWPVFDYAGESDPGPYPIPPSPAREWGSDHHVLALDAENCMLYELYDAERATGQWHAGSGAIWDLTSNHLRPDGWTSADAAGLPILPGLVRYEEILAGEIRHAIRFTASATNSYIWPARHLTSGSPGVLTDIPPMGARFRLKASFDVSGYPTELQVILRAMQRYGIILADNGSDWYVSGAPDRRWDNDMLHLLDAVEGSDFEAVDVSSLQVDSDSGEVRLNRWKPAIGNRLQIQYTGAIDLTKDVDIYNLDLFETDASQVSDLHAQGKRVMCYLSAGSWEDWRPDADRYPSSVLGKEYEGWPGERWLDIRRINLLSPLLGARLDLCRAKGFDGVDPDNVDGYQNDTGFPLTARDQLRFNAWLANEAHGRGLAIGLKNDIEQAKRLRDHFDWALTEDCFDQGWCDHPNLASFIAQGKPVFDVEYKDNGIRFDRFCKQVTALQHSGLYKRRNLNAYLRVCP